MINKQVALLIAVVLIVGTIWRLEISKTDRTRGEALTTGAPKPSPTSPPGAAAPNSAAADAATVARRARKAQAYPPAREIVPGGAFINSAPFHLKDFIGAKVILLDFWTYSCINCQRTTPYLNAWYQKYKDQGFVIVGVHTPEFEFEKVYDNVLKNTRDLGITYPVVQDNDSATWRTYENQFWPHEYLIDIDGFIVHDHVGEGGYDETERAIQAALRERAQVLGVQDGVANDTTNPADAIAVDPAGVQSPETYFGAARNEYLGNGTRSAAGPQQLSLPTTIHANRVYLEGNWDFQDEYARNSIAGAKIVYTYHAKNVYLVASGDAPVPITIMVDGVVTDHQVIRAHTLYPLVHGTAYGTHTLQVQIDAPGLTAYTLTFG